MLADAAAELDIALHVQTPSPSDPAASRAAALVKAPLDDPEATRSLAAGCGAISFENEWIPLGRLLPLVAEGVSFVPSLDALVPLISKRGQRELLDRLHLPCPRWCGLEAVLAPLPRVPAGGLGGAGGLSLAPGGEGEGPFRPVEQSQRPTLPAGFRFPMMAKASRGGYDGKGTVPILDQRSLEGLLDHVFPSDWILEELVAFEQELALVACRDRDGTVACFPLVQTHQHHQVCDWVLMPAPVNHAVEAFARNVAASLLTALDYVGVLAIEFFYGPGGLQVNELAPRTHNSGHLTIEACRCSQFSQQVRLVAGLPMGSTEAMVPGALMVNLLGPDEPLPAQELQARLEALAALPGAHLHWYGKAGSAPGRKLGHLTVVLQSADGQGRLAERDGLLEQIRRIWPLPLRSGRD
jgi:5-(carboxyamino)imidazole ribonucleotide synthase